MTPSTFAPGYSSGWWTFSSVPFRANEIKRDSSVIAIDSSLPQRVSNRLADHLYRRHRCHAPVIRAVHAAGQAVRTIRGGKEVLPIDPDGRGSWEAQRLGLLLRGHFDKADRFSDLSLSQRLTEPLQREIVRRAFLPIQELNTHPSLFGSTQSVRLLFQPGPRRIPARVRPGGSGFPVSREAARIAAGMSGRRRNCSWSGSMIGPKAGASAAARISSAYSTGPSRSHRRRHS